MAERFTYFTHTAEADRSRATVRIDRSQAAPDRVPAYLFGKFCEHLGANIYHGMEAQILLNCTFSPWHFSIGERHPDGGAAAECDVDKVRQRAAQEYTRRGWPDPDGAAAAYHQGCAFGWAPAGEVRLTPDVGPYGGRAQRVEAEADGAGLVQWTALPIHRTHSFGFRLVARASSPTKLTLALGNAAGGPEATAAVALTAAWQTFTGELDLPDDASTEGNFRLSIRLPAGANVVIDRLLLYPDDHLAGADPDVVRLLREAKLPLLRWPGGNFVSGYRWRDGVGPVDARPVVPNPAWSGLEFNTFGTAEFIAFCRLVGCDPMICVNAGDGTPEEAAAWVQYCNGDASTPMGRLRAEHGHPAPFGVRLWEIGNELYGRWQVGWTTPAGNADRYHRFRTAMLAADPTIELLGCGQGNAPLGEWNRTLLREAGPDLACLTDHILTGGDVDATVNGHELLQAFLGQATVLEQHYAELRRLMLQAGIADPRLAITELQLFAHFRGELRPGGLSPATMPRQDSMAEALYYLTILHAAIRLGSFVKLVTHSATVNHGGGLRKQQERVWANPVHYAHSLSIALGGGAPLAVAVTSATYGTGRNFASIPKLTDVPVIDAVAVRQADGVVLSVINRCAEPVAVQLDGVGEATATVLSAEAYYVGNTLDGPTRVVPREVTVRDGVLSLPGYGYALVVLR